MYTYGIFTSGMYTSGMYTYSTYIYGMYTYAMKTYGKFVKEVWLRSSSRKNIKEVSSTKK